MFVGQCVLLERTGENVHTHVRCYAEGGPLAPYCFQQMGFREGEGGWWWWWWGAGGLRKGVCVCVV